MKRVLIGLVVGLLIWTSARASEPSRFQRRWVWVMCNLQVAKEADRVVDLIERASKAGYTALVISDYKLNFLQRVPDFYFKHVERVKVAASEHGIELIPAVFPIGYANGLLSNDVNLAEGLPVVDAPFVVHGRDAALAPFPAARIKNGDLEEYDQNHFSEFGFQDAIGESSFVDHSESHRGKTSIRMENWTKTPVCRLIQSVRVRPRACYRLSAWVKTDQFSPTSSFRLLAIAKGGRSLTFHEGGVEPTGDWKQLEVVFNTLDSEEVNIYAGVWGGRSGRLWIDEISLEEMGLVNVLRRPGCPLTVTSQDRATTYVEGEDFEPVLDPKLGRVPYEGEYSFQHDAPSIRLTRTSRIKSGEHLLVSWYHPVLVHGNVVMCCLSEPKVYELLADQARRVNELYHPKTFFMQHDEMRVANWCRACQSRGLTPGQLLADNAKRCAEIIKQVSPDARVAVWSDMFDPNHNAVNNYYLVNGSLAGSWEGLDPSITVVNWNGGKPKASLDFFARRGHEQVIAGYYDSDNNIKTWLSASLGVPKVNGFMYTTWSQRYGDLEISGRSIREALKE